MKGRLFMFNLSSKLHHHNNLHLETRH